MLEPSDRRINRIVVLTVDSLYSAIALPCLLKRLPGKVVLICESRQFGGRYGSTWAQAWKHYSRSGLRFLIYLALPFFFFFPMNYFVDHINRWLGRPKRLYSLHQLAGVHGIPVVATSQPNSDAIVNCIRAAKADLIISFYFDRVIKKPLIDLPKFGIVNVHPGSLPDMRGLCSNIWSVISGRHELGASVHYIDSEDLDVGPILKIRKMDRDPHESMLASSCRLARLGAKLAVDTIAELENGIAEPRDQGRGGCYFSYPTRKDLRIFRRRGGCLYSVSDFVRQF